MQAMPSWTRETPVPQRSHLPDNARNLDCSAAHDEQHSIDENGTVTPSRFVFTKGKLEDCHLHANSVQQRTVSSFDRDRFRDLLLEWITADSTPLRKIESKHFRRLLALVGHNLRLEDHLPIAESFRGVSAGCTTSSSLLSRKWSGRLPHQSICHLICRRRTTSLRCWV